MTASLPYPHGRRGRLGPGVSRFFIWGRWPRDFAIMLQRSGGSTEWVFQFQRKRGVRLRWPSRERAGR